MISFARSDKNALSEWWWTVDRLMLAAVFALILSGIVFVLAASPAIARRNDFESFHFVWRQLSFLAPSVALMLFASLLTPKEVRRVAVGVFCASFILMIAVLFVGTEIKGAHRWLSLGPMSLQPSEFAKPAFLVVSAWLLARAAGGRSVSLIAAITLLGGVCGVLMLQPDFGQTMLICVTWAAMFFMAGMSMWWIAVFGMAGIGLAFGAYTMLPHVSARVDRFLAPDQSGTDQVAVALKAVSAGGFFGVGPGEGLMKHRVPDAHTDFIFSVIAEEFGAVTCLLIAGLFAFIIMRGLTRAQEVRDPFVQLAIAGLSLLIGLQAMINMAVNLSLLPAKGMTLPFVSYGGSSLLATCFTMGLLLALLRRRPQAAERWRWV
ncbi:MAG: putative lipid II flippase FtsW [Alphaproteobacteria bacterium]|nr:putative lipid II flippase FtsW [Alphaproteobacteria bacterium]